MKVIKREETVPETIDDTYRLEVEVRATPEEVALLEERDRDTVNLLFKTAGANHYHDGGAGRPFMQEPSYSICRNGVVTVYQRGGWDI